MDWRSQLGDKITTVMAAYAHLFMSHHRNTSNNEEEA